MWLAPLNLLPQLNSIAAQARADEGRLAVERQLEDSLEGRWKEQARTRQLQSALRGAVTADEFGELQARAAAATVKVAVSSVPPPGLLLGRHLEGPWLLSSLTATAALARV